MKRGFIAVSFSETAGGEKASLARANRWTHVAALVFGLGVSAPAAADGLYGGIINGEASADGARPWQVSLQTPAGTHFCGGSIIDANWIVTAAHCVDGLSAGGVDVLAGANDLSVGGERKDIQTIVKHALYDSQTVDQDIALLRLTSPLECLGLGTCAKIGVITPANSTLAAPGSAALVSGWGDTDPDPYATSYPLQLQEVLVSVLNTADCNAAGSYDGSITGNMLCAGFMPGGKDSCQGDSGGPLVVRNSDGVSYLLAGIVSWGYECAAQNYPGIYTKVENYTDWLVNQTGLAEADLTAGAVSTISSNRVALYEPSGGCALGTDERFDPLLPLLAVAAVAYLRRRRRA